MTRLVARLVTVLIATLIVTSPAHASDPRPPRPERSDRCRAAAESFYAALTDRGGPDSTAGQALINKYRGTTRYACWWEYYADDNGAEVIETADESEFEITDEVMTVEDIAVAEAAENAAGVPEDAGISAQATPRKYCATLSHRVTGKYYGFTAYKHVIRKSWCWTNSLYPVVVGPFRYAQYVEIVDSEWEFQGFDLNYHDYFGAEQYIHQTLGTFKFFIDRPAHPFGDLRRNATNSVCGYTNARYTTKNDCGGTFKFVPD